MLWGICSSGSASGWEVLEDEELPPPEEALPEEELSPDGVLEEALESVGYADYCVLRDAIESLGGTVEGQPDFSGDSDYEKMKLL